MKEGYTSPTQITGFDELTVEDQERVRCAWEIEEVELESESEEEEEEVEEVEIGATGRPRRKCTMR